MSIGCSEREICIHINKIQKLYMWSSWNNIWWWKSLWQLFSLNNLQLGCKPAVTGYACNGYACLFLFYILHPLPHSPNLLLLSLDSKQSFFPLLLSNWFYLQQKAEMVCLNLVWIKWKIFWSMAMTVFQMICLLGLDTIHALSLHNLIGTHKGRDMLPDVQFIITLGR